MAQQYSNTVQPELRSQPAIKAKPAKGSAASLLRTLHFIAIVWAIITFWEFSFPVASISFIPANSNNHIDVTVNGFGQQSGFSAYSNLVTIGSDNGFLTTYLWLGFALLLGLLIVGAVTLNKWVAFAAIFVTGLLFIMYEYNRAIAETISVNTTATDVHISILLPLAVTTSIPFIISLASNIPEIMRRKAAEAK